MSPIPPWEIWTCPNLSWLVSLSLSCFGEVEQVFLKGSRHDDYVIEVHKAEILDLEVCICR